ncbi:MAG: DUF4383 domain-containing protein [Thermoplasmatota archaeon]
MDNMNAMLAKVFGVVFLAVGLLGFVINPTLIVFGVTTTHNIVHLLSGAILLAAGFMRGGTNARMANQIFGVVYILVAILGFLNIGFVATLLGSGSDSFTYADALLHLVLGVVLAGVGFGVKDATTPGSKMSA